MQQVNRGLLVILVILAILTAGVWIWYLRARTGSSTVEIPQPGPSGPQVAPVQKAPIGGVPNQPQKAAPQGL
ncbi:MAG: hypothetical protein NZ805_08815 [Armatimonadetes bacterium]|nr:hypothetical protein [Armatimonadota bacterium]MDW8028208.1 hypothetical protein [Armatimonadota bacterium]